MQRTPTNVDTKRASTDGENGHTKISLASVALWLVI